MRMIAALCSIIGFLCSVNVHAATIQAVETSTELAFVSVKGELEDGDAQRFSDVIKGLHKVIVVLESPGGLIDEGLGIGATIRRRSFSTMVPGGKECFSACGLIWLAGVRIYMNPDSQIGFHAVYTGDGEDAETSGSGNAEVGAYLSMLGLRIEAIRYLTTAGAADLLPLTPSIARILGIDVHVLVDGRLETPSEHPTVDAYIDRAVSYLALEARCAKVTSISPGEARRQAAKALEQARKLVGEKQQTKLLGQAAEAIADEFDERGYVAVCRDIEARLPKARTR